MEKHDEPELLPPQVLAEKFKSKRDLYKLLVTDCKIFIRLTLILVKYFLPSYKQCSLSFIKQILSGEKKVSKRYDNKFLGIQKIWALFNRCPRLWRIFNEKCLSRTNEQSISINLSTWSQRWLNFQRRISSIQSWQLHILQKLKILLNKLVKIVQ